MPDDLPDSIAPFTLAWRLMADTTIAIDFGASNTDVVVRSQHGMRRWKFASVGVPSDDRVRQLLEAVELVPGHVAWIATTGGNRHGLSTTVDGVRMVQADEVQAVGRGGLALANVSRAIVVSAGSGTAVISAATLDTTVDCQHVTGTGVGGGTLVGLGRMLINEADPRTLDALALAGNAARLNLTIGEILGGAIGSLPPDITAVNFGRVARAPMVASREDTAAALVNMVGQVIAIIAINAAQARQHHNIVVVGHLTDLPSIRDIFLQVSGLYGTPLLIPESGGYATATGALLVADALLHPSASARAV